MDSELKTGFFLGTGDPGEEERRKSVCEAATRPKTRAAVTGGFKQATKICS